MEKHLHQRGFTFIELLLVTALISSVLSFSIFMGTDTIAREGVREARDQFVSLVLTSARTHAIANVNETAHGVHIDMANHVYVLFEGTTFIAGASTNRNIPFSNTRVAVSHSLGDTDIVFESLSGNVLNGSGTITFSYNETHLAVVINAVGQIDW